MAWKMVDVGRFIDPRFGPDPYFKRVAGRAECSDKHLEYMFRIVWPLIASYRKVIVAQKAMTTYTALGMFAVGDRDLNHLGAGHVLYEDFPGKGKTILAGVPAIVLGASFGGMVVGEERRRAFYGRVQADPEKTPTDYTGNRMIDIDAEGKRYFRLVPGPAFADIQLIDEVNRLSADTMSILLEILSEGTLTIFDKTYKVNPFVLFTMNPIETEGTRKLLEALTDRIMFKITGEWFCAKHFADILERTNEYKRIRGELQQVCEMTTVHEIREFFHESIYVDPDVRQNVFGRFAEISNDPHRFGFLQSLEDQFKDRVVRSGLSGRGVAHWEGAAKTLAAFRYRDYVIPEDALKVLLPVLRHRMRFTPGALEFFTDLWRFPEKSAAIDRIILQLIREAW